VPVLFCPLVVDREGNSRPIDEIEVGDFVLARSEFDPDGPLELKRVEEKFVRTAVVMELVVHGQSIATTAEHPFYVPAQGKFVAAGELQVGEHLVGHDGNLVQIESIGSTGEVTTVYNLRVADFHTYFVGGTIWGWDVWVHNALYGTQNPITAWAAKTGRAYDRRFRAIWRQFEGQTIGDWEVAAVNRRLAKGIQPDLVLVDHQMKTVNVHDFTSAYSDAHYAKGLDYVMHLKKQYMGYRVEYTESYWANSTMTVEATAKNGVKYLPGTSKP